MALLCIHLGCGEMMDASSHADTDTGLKRDVDIMHAVDVILDLVSATRADPQ